MITSPYNFVPLNDKVFYPDWAESISHDIPFEDGVSGEIKISLKAVSPIFVANSGKNKERNETLEFCNHKGQHYIPGSSIKGVIRTICEVLSFSKLNFQDRTFSYRDLNNPSYKSNAMNQNRIYMGYLYKNKDDWQIKNLGKVTNSITRITYKDMYKYFDRDKVEKVKVAKSARDKYKVFADDLTKLDTVRGRVIFTGTTGKDKTREFIFPKVNNPKVITLRKDIIDTFKEGYYIGTPNESSDWKNLWSKKTKNR